jgi:hypothetical protein
MGESYRFSAGWSSARTAFDGPDLDSLCTLPVHSLHTVGVINFLQEF